MTATIRINRFDDNSSCAGWAHAKREMTAHHYDRERHAD
jgi:hypothetical protein